MIRVQILTITCDGLVCGRRCGAPRNAKAVCRPTTVEMPHAARSNGARSAGMPEVDVLSAPPVIEWRAPCGGRGSSCDLPLGRSKNGTSLTGRRRLGGGPRRLRVNGTPAAGRPSETRRRGVTPTPSLQVGRGVMGVVDAARHRLERACCHHREAARVLKLWEVVAISKSRGAMETAVLGLASVPFEGAPYRPGEAPEQDAPFKPGRR